MSIVKNTVARVFFFLTANIIPSINIIRKRTVKIIDIINRIIRIVFANNIPINAIIDSPTLCKQYIIINYLF